MTTDQLLAALTAAADAMRRSDPTYCAALGVEHVTDAQWDGVLACAEKALDAVKERNEAF